MDFREITVFKSPSTWKPGLTALTGDPDIFITLNLLLTSFTGMGVEWVALLLVGASSRDSKAALSLADKSRGVGDVLHEGWGALSSSSENRVWGMGGG